MIPSSSSSPSSRGVERMSAIFRCQLLLTMLRQLWETWFKAVGPCVLARTTPSRPTWGRVQGRLLLIAVLVFAGVRLPSGAARGMRLAGDGQELLAQIAAGTVTAWPAWSSRGRCRSPVARVRVGRPAAASCSKPAARVDLAELPLEGRKARVARIPVGSSAASWSSCSPSPGAAVAIADVVERFPLSTGMTPSPRCRATPAVFGIVLLFRPVGAGSVRALPNGTRPCACSGLTVIEAAAPPHRRTGRESVAEALAVAWTDERRRIERGPARRPRQQRLVALSKLGIGRAPQRMPGTAGPVPSSRAQEARWPISARWPSAGLPAVGSGAPGAGRRLAGVGERQRAWGWRPFAICRSVSSRRRWRRRSISWVSAGEVTNGRSSKPAARRSHGRKALRQRDARRARTRRTALAGQICERRGVMSGLARRVAALDGPAPS